MRDQRITLTETATVNLPKLDADLRAALGAKIAGLSHDGDAVIVHFLADAPDLADEAAAARIVDAHDPAALTAAQQAAADRAAAVGDAGLRQAILTTAQSAVGVKLTDLTLAQVKALVAVLLWRRGAITPDGTVAPLGQWDI